MSETELSVICKNCGSEVSPYVTECPYCGARLRKRAPKLERRGDALEAQRPKRRRRRLRLRRPGRPAAPVASRSTTTGPTRRSAVILGSAILLLVQKATGDSLSTFGGLIVPFGDEWWRYLTAPFAYVDVGYLFVVAVGLAIFAHRGRAPARQRPDRARCCSPAGRSGCSPRAASPAPRATSR